MKITLKKTYQGYIFYGILLTLCLLYFGFPSDTFRDYFIKAVSRANPQVMVSIEDIRPSLTLGVILLNTRFSLQTNPHVLLFSAKRITIRPGIWSFLTGNLRYNFNCLTNDGEIEGFFQCKKNDNENILNSSFELKDILIDDFNYLSTLIGHNSRGTVNGTVTLKGQTNILLKGTGKANLKISDGTVALKKPLFDLETINFDELLVKLALKNQQIKVTHFKLKGKELQGTLSGDIRLNRNFMNSRLDLDGTIKLLTASFFKYDKGELDTNGFIQNPLELLFEISGTIEKPEYNFS